MKHHFKNFFIPHEGNNFHPHVLHSKRAIFYASFFVALKLFVVSLIILLPLQVFVVSDLWQDEADKIVQQTNNIREAEGLTPLAEHAQLYISAQYKAHDMASRAYFEHTSPQGLGLKDWLKKAQYPYRVAGENLAMGFFDAHKVMRAWINSPAHFKNLVDPDYQELGIGIELGNYAGKETAYMVQHFGTRSENVLQTEAHNALSVASQNITNLTPEHEVLSEIHVSDDLLDPSNTEVPLLSVLYNKDMSYISWEKTGDGIDLHVRAYIRGDIAQASVEFKQYIIPLHQNDELFIWTGTIHVFESVDELFNPMLSARIVVEDDSSIVYENDMPWQSVPALSTSVLEKYDYAKHASFSTTSLWHVSRIVYVFFIVFFTIALALKILIAYHRQHHHIILQTVLLIALLVVLFEI